MSGDNATSGGNQQETNRTLEPHWVLGFVDGEGCFCVSIHRNPYVRKTRGWQLHPVFQVSQHERRRNVLEELQSFFGCGRVRSKGPRSSVSTYAVDSLRDLEIAILPFFERHRLLVKGADFAIFAELVKMIRRKEHLTASGFERAVRLAYGMNAVGKQRSRPIEAVLEGSSETARQAPSATTVKVQSDPHGDMGSQAEMTWPLPRQPVE